jgi:CRISPR-associated protein Csb1
LRDSLRDGRPFRPSEPGRRFTEGSPSNAAAIFDLDPASMVFGVWDSTGRKGGLGSKFQRALVGEIVGVGAGLRDEERKPDHPAGIQKTEVYEAGDPEQVWTIDPAEAKGGPDKPVLLKRRGEKAASPAVIKHGSVKPSADPEAGGVTIDHAGQVTVLSLPALRRLRFPRKPDGTRLEGEEGRAAERAARAAGRCSSPIGPGRTPTAMELLPLCDDARSSPPALRDGYCLGPLSGDTTIPSGRYRAGTPQPSRSPAGSYWKAS